MSDQLVGIVAYGGYVPATRLPLAMIHGGRVKEGGAEKAVAGFDEDAITMAVSAATNCLHGIDRTTIDGDARSRDGNFAGPPPGRTAQSRSGR